MNYQQKYLKYKNKYLELKNQTGGYDFLREATKPLPIKVPHEIDFKVEPGAKFWIKSQYILKNFVQDDTGIPLNPLIESKDGYEESWDGYEPSLTLEGLKGEIVTQEQCNKLVGYELVFFGSYNLPYQRMISFGFLLEIKEVSIEEASANNWRAVRVAQRAIGNDLYTKEMYEYARMNLYKYNRADNFDNSRFLLRTSLVYIVKIYKLSFTYHDVWGYSHHGTENLKGEETIVFPNIGLWGHCITDFDYHEKLPLSPFKNNFLCKKSIKYELELADYEAKLAAGDEAVLFEEKEEAEAYARIKKQKKESDDYLRAAGY